MKKILLALALIISVQALQAQSDAISSFFDQYKDDDRFTIVNISPKLFEMMSGMATEEVDDPELSEMIKNMKGLMILTTEITPMKYYREAVEKINTSDFEELMTVRDEGQNVQILVKEGEKKNLINELLILVGGEDEFVFLSFIGQFQLDKLAKLAEGMDIEGMEHLENIDKE
jgi:hypothetical protein